MFTGIIETLGVVVKIENIRQQKRFVIKPQKTIEDFRSGESIAINGVCLTVEKFSAAGFEVFASTETLAVTNLQKLQISHVVNLERALQVGARIGGHFVSGHIDTMALVTKITSLGATKILRLEFAEKYSANIVPKGSIAIDGVSLTVNKCGQGYFEVSIIPETLSATTLGTWTQGYVANLEVDLLSKYITKTSSIDLNLLYDTGFITGEKN